MLRSFIIGMTLIASLGADYDKQIEEINDPVTIAFAGDAMMDWSVKETIKQKGSLYPFQDVKSLIEGVDYAVMNLETAVTTKNEVYEKQFNFKTDPVALEGIRDAGFDLMSLANNHIMDYKEVGLLDTMEYIKKAGLSYIGVGKDSQEAYSAKRILIKGKTVSFLAFSHVLPSYEWYVGEEKPGVASGYQLDAMTELIIKEKEQNDYVFVNIHWGEEKMTKPLAYQEEYARAMIDVGADGIIGHHPHVLQGFEYYKGKPIAYSLGNFLFPNYVSGKSAETGVLVLSLEEDGIKLHFNPFYIEQDQIVKKDTLYEKQILSYLQDISLTKGLEITMFE